MKILVVDDSETNRMLLQFTLEDMEFGVDEAENGEKAVEMALKNNYVAILMDLNMPVMNGREACKILNSVNFEPPIIACSAEEDTDVIETLLKSGFAAFVPKPIEAEFIAHTFTQLSISANSVSDSFNQKHQQKLAQLSERFAANILATIENLKIAMQAEDPSLLQSFSHKLKTNAAQFGYPEISNICREIEFAVSNSNQNSALEKSQTLILELQRINDASSKHR